MKPSTFKISNLSFHESYDTLYAYLQSYGAITNLSFTKNKFALVTFTSYNPRLLNEEIILNNKILKVQAIFNDKKPLTQTTKNRVFISHIYKNLKIVDIRNLIVELFRNRPLNVKVRNDGRQDRNNGYCFVEFKSEKVCEEFIKWFEKNTVVFGKESKIEYANQKKFQNIKR